MNKFKIIKLVLFGNIIISLPIILIAFYLNFYVSIENRLYYLFITLIISIFYWSYMVALYKSFSIKRVLNKAEYFYWKKLSINTLLFWPDNFLLTKLEYWDEEKYIEYKNRKSLLLGI